MTPKKWLKRLAVAAGLLAVVLVCLLVAGSVVARRIAQRRAEGNFPAPGRLVEFAGRSSHILCAGTGSPTILLESGMDIRGSLSWAGIHADLSHVSRVCAYDRAGYMWSEAREGPRDAERIATELHALLAASSETPPYILVGHSMGGELVLAYDHQFPGEAAGFVLVDASHPEQARRFPEEVRERLYGEQLPLWVFRLFAPYVILAGPSRNPEDAYWWRSFPQAIMPEFEAAEAISKQAARTRSLGDRPLVVLAAGVIRDFARVSSEGNAAYRRVWLEMQQELAQLSTNADFTVVKGASHDVHGDRPEVVVEAIREVVVAAREGRRLKLK
jgi:pimeloyl-ACP methyl ester carboxylesterase